MKGLAVEHRCRTVALLVAFLAVAAPAVAAAHIDLVGPGSRYGRNNIKSAPCGDGSDTRSSTVFTYTAGETITLEWEEYVDHPGHYRVAFDPDGTDDFQAPNCTSDCSTRNPSFEFDVNDAVLVDDISDKSGGTYTTTVQLPEVTCDRCVLQVIQVMYDKPPFEVPGNDLYYQCADLKLVAPSNGDVGPDADAGPDADTGLPPSDTDTADPASDTRDRDTGDRKPADTASKVSDSSVSGAADGSEESSGGSDAGCTTVPSDRRVPPFVILFVGLLVVRKTSIRLVPRA